MVLRFVHVAIGIDSPLLFMAERYFITWMYHSLFILPYTDALLSCSSSGIIMNRAAINIFAQAFLWMYIFVFLDKYSEVELSGHRVSERSLTGNCQTFFYKWSYRVRSHRRYKTVRVAPHLEKIRYCQSWSILVILVDVSWCYLFFF